jgi:serine kinase of HPr protein (carbohydrate metabolism regulator)
VIKIAEFIQELNLEVLSASSRDEMDINSTDLNRPGMQFFGFYEYFAYERPQVIGKVEMTYLESLDPEKRRSVLEVYMNYKLPCIVVCWGMIPPKELWSWRASTTFPCSRATPNHQVFASGHHVLKPLPRAARDAPRGAGGRVRRGRCC